jgi:hypothetical protein
MREGEQDQSADRTTPPQDPKQLAGSEKPADANNSATKDETTHV